MNHTERTDPMKLEQWMERERVSQAELARRVTALGRKSATQGAVSQWLTGRIPSDRVPELVHITGGEVRPQDMRPDLYCFDDVNVA